MSNALTDAKKPREPPWETTTALHTEIAAMKAITCGEATADQQRLFLNWFERATAVNELEFRAHSERESSFAAGKRFVGLQFFILAKAHMPSAKQG